MSSHMAAEFINKFEHDREPLPAIALTTDSAVVTSIANDSNFKWVFQRQIKALGKTGDTLLIFTTSDHLSTAGWDWKNEYHHSENIYHADSQAQLQNIQVIYAPRIGESTAKKQEYQFQWMHDVCREVESAFI